VIKNFIPAVAMLADSAANSGVLSMETLPKMLHEKGINLRYLGLIWSQLKNKTARKILLSEMAARVIKQRLRSIWRSSQNLGALSVHAHFVQTHRYLKEVFCDWKSVEWNEINKDLIQKYFYTFDLPTTVVAWQERVLPDRVCAYVCDRCGIQMAEGVIDSVLVQKSKFAFLLADIRAIIAVASIPQIVIPQLAAALQQVKQSIDASHESDRTGFAEEACSLVSNVPHFDLYQAESMCIQGEAYFNWAQTLTLMHARQALQHAENGIAVILAVDLLAIDRTDVSSLLEPLTHDVGQKVDVSFAQYVQESTVPDPQPLCAAWRVQNCLPTLRQQFEGQQRSVMKAWLELQRQGVSLPQSHLININSPGDIENFQQSKG
jgi:hypothetical protein